MVEVTNAYNMMLLSMAGMMELGYSLVQWVKTRRVNLKSAPCSVLLLFPSVYRSQVCLGDLELSLSLSLFSL